MAKRQRRNVGDFLKIKVEENLHTYARVLDGALFAFYDAYAAKEMVLDEIKSAPILFKVWVMRHAVTSGRWQVVGNSPLEESLRVEPHFFKKDALHPEQISIYHRTQEYSSTIEECRGLECAAVWSAEHVEDRLRDHYVGRPNKWLESMKLKE